eukprot:CAMPEP_0174242686 /NCGR_PEP_ID=MMETSP0417-20130205/28767_1 /TAXON_ID=242541 /ORGANISM="Mayorella sp, Strain BSH-02190019" /LENGTH=1001 /DNA_ID=CAMNT_0015322109 /DNA_START=190 /DNA_END=3195 /DNA_ORIENTATION=+
MFTALTTGEISHVRALLSLARSGGGGDGRSSSFFAKCPHRVGRNGSYIHFCSRLGKTECLRELLAFGLDIHTKDCHDETSLHVASRNGMMECVRALMQHGANVNAREGHGWSALVCASLNGRTELLRYLLQFNPDVNEPDLTGRLATHFAAKNGHIGCLRLMLDAGCSATLPDEDGNTPLHLSVNAGSVAALKMLLDAGADLRARNHKGQTTLLMALEVGRTNIVEAILDADPTQYADLTECLRHLEGVFESTSLAQPEKSVESRVAQVVRQLSGKATVAQQLMTTLAESFRAHLVALLSGTSHNTDLSTTPAIMPSSFNVIAASAPNSLSPAMASTPGIATTDPNTGQLDHVKALRCVTKWSVAVMAVHPCPPDSQLNAQLPLLFDASSSRSEQLSESPAPWLSLRQISVATMIHAALDAVTQHIDGLSHQLDGLSSSSSRLTHYQSLPAAATVAPIASPSSSSSPSSLASATASPSFEKDLVDSSMLSEVNTVLPPAAAASTLSSSSSPSSPLSAASTAPGSDSSNAAESTKIGVSIAHVLQAVFELTNVYHVREVRGFFQFLADIPSLLEILIHSAEDLTDGAFDFLLRHLDQLPPHITEVIHRTPIQAKLCWFRRQIDEEKASRASAQSDAEQHNDQLVFVVRRESLLLHSCSQLSQVVANSVDILKSPRFGVQFEGEEGVGAGVSSEFFRQISAELFNVDNSLFVQSSDGLFQPSPESAVNPDHLSFFQFAGRICGLAMYHNFLLNVFLTLPFHKQILGLPVGYMDLQTVDPAFWKNLDWIVKNNVDEADLGLTFEVLKEGFGKSTCVELVPNGAQIDVTEKNKMEYVQLQAEHKLHGAIAEQVDSFVEGVHEIISPELLGLFSAPELSVLLSGVDHYELSDWRENTEYRNGFTRESDTVRFFWEYVEGLSHEQRGQLLQFATGAAHVPVGGFGAFLGVSGPMPFTIARLDASLDSLPLSSTCFKLLKLPPYTSLEQLSQRLTAAITYGRQGFGFA